MSVPLFRCGHPRSAENTTGTDPRCRTCKRASNAASRATITTAERHLEHRIRYLPTALERTRAKLRQLEAEAASYGMRELLENPAHANRAWDRAILTAQGEAEAHGGSIGFAEARR